MSLDPYSLFGLIFILGGMISLLAGRTYCRGIIDRDNTPFDYWFVVGSLFAIGIFIFSKSILLLVWALTVGGASLIARGIFCLSNGRITGAFGIFKQKTQWYVRDTEPLGFWASLAVHLIIGTLMLAVPVLAIVNWMRS